MTREQAINYLICRGLTNEQVGDVVRALTYKPRDCANCKHYVVTDTRTNWGSQGTTKIYGCERWECEYEPTTKNDLGVDCISRQSVLDKIQRLINAEQNNIDENGDYMNYARERVNAYEAIQFFVENDCLCPSVTPQEPFINKACVSSGVCEHDKNKVLDKIRAEIETKYGQCDICEYFEDYDYEENDISEYRPIGNIGDILQIIDRYRAESEARNDTNFTANI